MRTFALEHIEEIKGKLNFHYLIIDENNQFEQTVDQIKKEGTFTNELFTLQARMQEMAEMKQPMPKTKCRDITPKNDTTKEYELKTKHLRCYLFHQKEQGGVIALLGRKTTQDKDIKRFRKIKKEYLNSLKHV